MIPPDPDRLRVPHELAITLAWLHASNETWEAMSATRELREYLCQRQHWRCAYCERSLRDLQVMDERSIVVEHYCPRNLQASQRVRCGGSRMLLSFDLDNLIASCDGHSLSSTDVTCDECKDGAHLCESLPNPNVDLDDVEESVSSSGAYRIVSRRFPTATAVATTSVRGKGLNLDKRSLKRERSAKLQSAARLAAALLRRGVKTSVVEDRLRQLARTEEHRTAYLTAARRLLPGPLGNALPTDGPGSTSP